MDRSGLWISLAGTAEAFFTARGRFLPLIFLLIVFLLLAVLPRTVTFAFRAVFFEAGFFFAVSFFVLLGFFLGMEKVYHSPIQYASRGGLIDETFFDGVTRQLGIVLHAELFEQTDAVCADGLHAQLKFFANHRDRFS